MRIKKAKLKAIIKEELSTVLTEYIERMRQAYNTYDKMSTGYSVYQDASKSNWGGVALTAAEAKWVTSPYAMIVYMGLMRTWNETWKYQDYWNSLPESDPIKVKHRAHMAKIKQLKKDSNRRARKAKYGYDPKEEILRREALSDARKMLKSTMLDIVKKADLSTPPADEEGKEEIEKWLAKTS